MKFWQIPGFSAKISFRHSFCIKSQKQNHNFHIPKNAGHVDLHSFAKQEYEEFSRSHGSASLPLS
ncbi:MAG: hypothetical protein GY795_07385 [Desulfobacterales bacterium]|nr:hypothetical protein [Desulfobacterales bacterium]